MCIRDRHKPICIESFWFLPYTLRLYPDIDRILKNNVTVKYIITYSELYKIRWYRLFLPKFYPNFSLVCVLPTRPAKLSCFARQRVEEDVKALKIYRHRVYLFSLLFFPTNVCCSERSNKNIWSSSKVFIVVQTCTFSFEKPLAVTQHLLIIPTFQQSTVVPARDNIVLVL